MRPDPPADPRRRTGSIDAVVSPRFALREATAEAHDRLDRLYACFDLGTAAGYGAFLLAHARAFLAVEPVLAAAGAAHVVPHWADRLRSAALLSDIAEMGLPPPQPAAPPVFGSEAEVLGGAYVLEGSRLGGAVLVRRVISGAPTAFLRPGNPADWRALVSALDLKLSSDTELAEAVSAARAVFALFEQAV